MDTELREYRRAVSVSVLHMQLLYIAIWLQHEPETLKYKTVYACDRAAALPLLSRMLMKGLLYIHLFECIVQIQTAQEPGWNAVISRSPLVCQINPSKKQSAWKDKAKLLNGITVSG